MKNKIFILIAIIIVIIIGIIIYYFYSIKNKGQTIPPVAPFEKTTEAQIHQVFKDDVRYPALSPDGKSIYYFNRQEIPGLFRKNLDGTGKQQLAEIDDINNIFWSPDFSKAIFEVVYQKYRFEKYQSPFLNSDLEDEETSYWFYEIESQSLKKLSSNINNAYWDKKQNRIIYHYLDIEKGKNEFLQIDANGSNPEKLIEPDCYSCQILLYSDTKQKIFYLAQITDVRQDLYLADLTNNKNTLIWQDCLGASVSGLGDYIIIEDVNNKTLLINSGDLKKQEINISINAPRSAWSPDEKFLIAVSPQDENTSDKLYKVNIETGEITELQYTPPEGKIIKPENLMITQDSKTLYFTSYDILYKLEL